MDFAQPNLAVAVVDSLVRCSHGLVEGTMAAHRLPVLPDCDQVVGIAVAVAIRACDLRLRERQRQRRAFSSACVFGATIEQAS